MTLITFSALAAVGLFIWWLTGRDKSYSGESKQGRHFARILRALAVVFLLWLMLVGGVVVLLFAPLAIALVLRSSISEICAGGFLRMVDPAFYDGRELDLKLPQRHRDNIAYLIHHGKRAEAIKLCEELKRSGELDETTLADALEFLGVKQNRVALERPLNRAARLRAEGNYLEAEQLLKSLLVKNPADTGAAMLLMRLYAGDFQQPSRAGEVLRVWESQKHVEPAQIEFARRSLDDWSRMKREEIQNFPSSAPESVDELLAQRHYGTAIERLEEAIRATPGDFALRLKLAEIHALYCDDLTAAGKVIRRLETEKIFNAEQLEMAAGELKKWREARGQRK
jgi:tetratricopeptide (TPR) repeat protein